MFFFWLLIGGITLVALGLLIKRPERLPDDDDFYEEDGLYEDDDPYEEDDVYQSRWETEYFSDASSRRPKGFVALGKFGDFNLAGTSAPKMHTRDFLRMADPSIAFASLKREPDNPHDANAIQVFGHANPDAPGLPIGYVPAQLAAQLNAEFSEDMPIDIELKKIGILKDSDRFFINARLTGPNAAKRKKFILELD